MFFNCNMRLGIFSREVQHEPVSIELDDPSNFAFKKMKLFLDLAGILSRVNSFSIIGLCHDCFNGR